MPRNPITASPPAWQPPSSAADDLTLRLRVVTPLFGGGHETRKVDAAVPIRAAAIRGQLRFWWRATAGAQCTASADLFKREEELWGSAEKYGKVAVQVNEVNAGKSDTVRSILDWKRDLQYALFPFQGDSNQDPADGHWAVSFTLILRGSSAQSDDVKQALNAWLLYGGVGARTRRGCGSVATDGNAPVLAALGQASGAVRVPMLAGANCVLGPPTPHAEDAWAEAVLVYQEFRQKPPYARATGADRTPGRSRWPEPDSLRRAMPLPAGKTYAHTPGTMPDAFPRADLGLPIEFKFKDSLAEPEKTRLEGPKANKRRFASPVITKAVQVAPGSFRPLILVLNAPHVWEEGDLALLKGSSLVKTIPPGQVNLTLADRARISPLHSQGDKPIREALLDYAAGKSGWTRGTLP